MVTEDDANVLEWPDWCEASGFPFGLIPDAVLLKFPTGVLLDLYMRLSTEDWPDARGSIGLSAFEVLPTGVRIEFGDGQKPHAAEILLPLGTNSRVQTVRTPDGRPCGTAVMAVQSSAILASRDVGRYAVGWPLVSSAYVRTGPEVSEILVHDVAWSGHVILGAKDGPALSGPESRLRLDVVADPILLAVTCALATDEELPVPISSVRVIRVDLSEFVVTPTAAGAVTMMVADLYGVPTALTITSTPAGITLELPAR